jgi:ABC-2 type transport system ATP-binding protein
VPRKTPPKTPAQAAWHHRPVRLDDVWVRYGRGPWVLRGVTAAIEAGDVVAVVGRNGAGKSTLLQVIAGTLRPNRGGVTERPARVGYVPERFPADQPFTARRYLTSIARVRGHGLELLPEWAERLHFTGLLDRPLNQLSKGSAQKVGLLQAMLAEPDLLILDEPWEGLDAQTRELVPVIVEEVLAAGGRVLISDHQGQTAELPGVRRWDLSAGELREAADSEAWVVVEVAVEMSDVDRAVATFESAGHKVLRIRGRREHTA